MPSAESGLNIEIKLGTRPSSSPPRGPLTSQSPLTVASQYVGEDINCFEGKIEPNFCLKSDKNKINWKTFLNITDRRVGK